MRWPGIVLALLIGGCAAAGIEPARLESPIQTGSIAPPPADAGEAARGELRKVQTRRSRKRAGRYGRFWPKRAPTAPLRS